MGILAAMVPSSMVSSLQEGLFDLAYIDDTSQSEAEGLLADGGLPIAESDAFKAWGKTFADGHSDCMKADFAFDWSKAPEDCVDGLHPTFLMWNATNLDTWGTHADGSFTALEVQEIGPFVTLKDVQKVENDASYWDDSGKARYRILETFTNSPKCDKTCVDFSMESTVATTNIWYGIFASLGLGDGWTLAMTPMFNTEGADLSGNPATVNNYLAATAPYPMDPHSAIPLPTRQAARMVDFTMFIYTPNAPKLGTVNVATNEDYNTVRNWLWNLGGKVIAAAAPAYGVPASVAPLIIKTTANGVLGWGDFPQFIWLDPLSMQAFTFNFVGGASGREVMYGVAPSAYIEQQMSSAFYHEGLGYITQHYELFSGPTTNTHSCAWDADCAPACEGESGTCVPLFAGGYDGGKIPGTYFGSAKGAPGFPAFTHFVNTYYLVIQMTSAGRVIIPVKYRGPDTPEKKASLEDNWDFEGFFAHSTFKASTYTRRLENCNYPGGRPVGDGVTVDSVGIDCNFVDDTSPLAPYFGLPVYWTVLPRNFVAPGWDPAVTNAEAGAGRITLASQVRRTSCAGNRFCTDAVIDGWGPAFTNFLHYGYEPNLGALVDVNLAGGLAWKLSPSPRHMHLMSDGYKFMPLFWVWNYLHLPIAINMDLAKLQGVPAALNGFYIFLLGQCLISLVGGTACCFCGV